MVCKRVLISAYYYHPCTHPVLENVFAKELGKTTNIIWFLQGDRRNVRVDNWFNSRVYITPMLTPRGLFSNIANYVFSYYKLILVLKYLIQYNVDIVLLRDLPVEALILSYVKSILGFKLYYQHSAPLGEMLMGYSKEYTTSAKWLKYIRGYFHAIIVNKVLPKVDMVFSISDFQMEQLKSNIDQSKLATITMGFDEQWLTSINRHVFNGLNKRADLADSYLIGYLGTLNFTRNPKFMLDVLSKVKTKIPYCRLMLIGKTATEREQFELENYCNILNIKEDIIFTGYLNRGEALERLVQCDLTISAIPPSDYFIRSSPTKIYESLGLGIPVVANREILEQNKVISESGGGVLVEYNADLFAMSIVQLLQDNEKRKVMSSKASDYIISNYSYRAIAENIASYFN